MAAQVPPDVQTATTLYRVLSSVRSWTRSRFTHPSWRIVALYCRITFLFWILYVVCFSLQKENLNWGGGVCVNKTSDRGNLISNFCQTCLLPLQRKKKKEPELQTGSSGVSSLSFFPPKLCFPQTAKPESCSLSGARKRLEKKSWIGRGSPSLLLPKVPPSRNRILLQARRVIWQAPPAWGGLELER